MNQIATVDVGLGGLSTAWTGNLANSLKFQKTTLILMDRLLSVKSGNPITIHDEDIGITWPTTVVCCLPWYVQVLADLISST